MPYSSLNEIPEKTSLFVFLLGLFGSVVNYTKRKNKTLGQRLFLFISDLISSVMLSVITFTSVVGLGGSEILAVGLAGFVAHQGTRAIYLIEIIIAKKFGVELCEDDLNKKGNKSC